jgi:HSP20 family protein
MSRKHLLTPKIGDLTMKIMKWHNEPNFIDLWNNFFENETYTPGFHRYCTAPAANIVEHEGDFQIDLAVPGMNKDDFKIDVENNLLTVSSEKQAQNEENDKNYTRKEFAYGSFSRSFTLPKSVNTDNINATYKNGILQIVLPKKEEEKVKVKREITID